MKPSPAPTISKHVVAPLRSHWLSVLWIALWAFVIGWGALRASQAIIIPTDLTGSVKLPTVNQAALESVRNRQSPTVIEPTVNGTPRANPFAS